jgi:bifunctional DNA-binding transcriptional regulator/antitoxin component of YhaV-PrlF toxin-antitoxin module
MPDGDRVQINIATDGHVSLPKHVCERHGWSEGTMLEIQDGPDGVRLAPVRMTSPFPATRPEDVFGMLKPFYDGPPKSIEEMHAGVEEEFRRQHALGRY